jgi:hypothetical protein
MPIRMRHGCLGALVGLPLFCVTIAYAVAAITAPWAFHIGGRTTPLLYWSGYGQLVAKSGTYPLYVAFFPSSHFFRLHLDGLRPTGGLQGTGSLCTSRGVTQRLNLRGTIFGGWSSTENSVMEFRLLEPKILDVGQRQGYFNLYGRWHGPKLVMEDRGETGNTFRSDLKIEHASVTLNWGGYSDFKAACAAATNRNVHP